MFCDLTCNLYLPRTDSRKDIQIANILLFSRQNDTGLVRKDSIWVLQFVCVKFVGSLNAAV